MNCELTPGPKYAEASSILFYFSGMHLVKDGHGMVRAGGDVVVDLLEGELEPPLEALRLRVLRLDGQHLLHHLLRLVEVRPPAEVPIEERGLDQRALGRVPFLRLQEYSKPHTPPAPKVNQQAKYSPHIFPQAWFELAPTHGHFRAVP